MSTQVPCVHTRQSVESRNVLPLIFVLKVEKNLITSSLEGSKNSRKNNSTLNVSHYTVQDTQVQLFKNVCVCVHVLGDIGGGSSLWVPRRSPVENS